MSLSSTTASAVFYGSGSAGPFTFGFRYYLNTDILVTTTTSMGVETLLAEGIAYTLSGQSVTLTNALAVGETLTIRRVMPITQPTSIRNQGAFFPEIHEDAFDRLCMQIQQVNDSVTSSDEIDRRDGNVLALAAAGMLGGQVAGVNAANYATLNAAVAAIGSTYATLYIDTHVVMNGHCVIPNNVCTEISYTGGIDKQGYSLTMNAPVAGPYPIFFGSGTVTMAARECPPEWWEAAPDDSTESGTAINAAMNSGAPRVSLGDGTYKVSTPLARSIESGTLEIVGTGNTIIDASGIADGTVVMDIGGSIGSSSALLADATEGAITIETSLTLAKGDIIKIESNGNWSPVRPIYTKGEIAEVYEVSGTTVTLTSPLCDSYTSFAAGGTGTNARGTSTVSYGRITALAITTGGSGYVNGETVYINTVDDYVHGAGAVGTATVVGGAITAVTITNGGYNFATSENCSIKSAYTKAYKINAPVIKVSGVTIKRSSDNASIDANFGIRVKYAKRVELEGVHAEYHNHTNISLLECYGATVRNCSTISDMHIGLGTAYGLAITSSQRVRVYGGSYYAGRHGVTHGGTYPCRDIVLDGVTIDNRCKSDDTSVPHCLDSHSNCQGLKVVNCTINSGAWIGAIDVIFANNTVKAREISAARSAVKFQPGKNGKYLSIIDNKITTYGTSVTLNHGIYICSDVGGDVAIDAVTIRDSYCKVSCGYGIYILSPSTPGHSFTIKSLNLHDNVVSNAGASQYAMAVVGQDAGLSIGSVNINGGSYSSASRAFYCNDTNTTIGVMRVRDADFATTQASGIAFYNNEGASVHIYGCGFSGPGTGTGLYIDNNGTCVIRNNTFGGLATSVDTGNAPTAFQIEGNIDNSTGGIAATSIVNPFAIVQNGPSPNTKHRLSWDTAAPTSGTHTNGDVVFDADTSSGGVAPGWVCITSGGAYASTRANSTAYALGAWAMWTTGTTVWECTTAGTSAGAAPDITGKVAGDTVTDGTAVWTMRATVGAAFKAMSPLAS